MKEKVAEISLEVAIEAALLAGGPDASAAPAVAETPPPFGEYAPGGYRKRSPEEYDRQLCLIPRDVFDFIYATQPKEWGEAEAAPRRGGEGALSGAAGTRGPDPRHAGRAPPGHQGVGLQVPARCFRPASGLNEELQRLYEANVFSVARQLHYSEKNDNSLDVVLFLNGLPIFTAELKNPFTGQNVEHAIRQYKFDRDPKEPLFAFGRCLAHLDPDLVYVVTHLEQKLAGDPALAASVRVNTPENARLTFDHVVTDRLQEMVDTNFKFYKRVTDDREFARFFVDWLFERFRKGLAD